MKGASVDLARVKLQAMINVFTLPTSPALGYNWARDIGSTDE